MRSVFNSLALFLFLLGVSVPAVMAPAQAAPAFKAPLDSAIVAKKRCEKCKRGKDGKMVCEEVDCP